MRLHAVLRPLAGVTLLLAAAGCRDGHLTGPPAEPEIPGRFAGIMEITISGIGTDQMDAEAAFLAPATSFAPTASLGGGGRTVGPDDGLQLQSVSTGSFTQGTRADGGVRYIYATFRVRNARVDGTAYSTPRLNPTFMAVATATTLHGTAVSRLSRFDGSAADPQVALSIAPTGAVMQDRGGALVPRFPDVLQILEADEASAVPAPTGVTVLPYGFVVSNPSTASSRTLPASPAPDQFDGVVTFAFRVPLQAAPTDDAFRISIQALVIDDAQTRITRSVEEMLDPQQRFEARAAALGATRVTLFGGGIYDGDVLPRVACSVQIGTSFLMYNAPDPCTLGGTLIWTGTTSADWADPGNWTATGWPRAPTLSDSVVVEKQDLDPVFPGGEGTVRSLSMTDGATLELDGGWLTILQHFAAPDAAVVGGTIVLVGDDATLRGGLDALVVRGAARLSGATRATGAVSVTGSLAVTDEPLSISIP
jgi:hypothetical protein